MKKAVIVIIFLVLALVLVGLFFWPSAQEEVSEYVLETEEVESLVPDIPEIIPETNPLEGEIQEVDPTEGTNPITESYTNPFE